MLKKEDKLLRWFYLLLLALIWGSSFILMKRGMMVFSADQVAALRMFVSFLSLFPLVIFHIRKIEKKYFKYLIATGLLGNGIPAFLFTHAQTKISSSMAGMLNSLTPVFVVFTGWIFFRSIFKVTHILGVVIGLAGAMALIYINSEGAVLNMNNWFGLLIVAATICYSFSVNIIRNYLFPVEALHITGFALFAAGIPCGIFLFTTDFIERFAMPHAWSSFGYIALLAIMGTAFSTILFNKLIKISNALYASSVTYLIPLVAMLWGVYDGEGLGIYHFLSMTCILSGVYLINYEHIKEMRSSEKET